MRLLSAAEPQWRWLRRCTLPTLERAELAEWCVRPTGMYNVCGLLRWKLTVVWCHNIWRVGAKGYLSRNTQIGYDTRNVVFLENWLTIRIHVPLVFVLWVSRRSIALGTFLPGEAYDWSGKRFPACNFLAPSCMWLRTMVPIGVRFFVYFLPNFSEKVMKHLHQGREGIAPWGSNNMTTINHLFVQLQTPPI